MTRPVTVSITLTLLTCAAAFVAPCFFVITTELAKWDRIFSELGVALPKSSQVLLDVARWSADHLAMAAVPAACLMLANVAVAVIAVRQQRRVVMLAWIAILSVGAVASGVILIWAYAAPETALVREMGLSRVPRAQDAARYVEVLGDDRHRREDRHEAARALRSLGLKYRVGLAQRPENASGGLIEIAGNIRQDVESRLLAAWALMVIDCESDEAQAAIAQAVLAALAEHEQQAVDSAVEGLRSEYVMNRTILHEIQHRTGDFDPTFMREELGTDSIGEAIGLLPTGSVFPSAKLDAGVAKMTDEDFAKEVAKVNEVYKSIAAVLDRPYGERGGSIKAMESGLRANETPLANLLVGATLPMLEAFVRSEAQLRGTQCLVMLRRRQLEQPGERPSDLGAVVKAAGMTEVPRDPYGDGPLRMVQLGNETIIYSIGKDGRDDKAQADWNHGQQPGDFIFRMKRTP